MTVNATNNEKPYPLLPVATTLAGGLIGGFAIGNKQTIKFDPEKVLPLDKFEVTGKLADVLTEEHKKVVTDINTNLQTRKNAKSLAEGKATDLFKNRQEISVSEFLEIPKKEKQVIVEVKQAEAPQKGLKAFLAKLFNKTKPETPKQEVKTVLEETSSEEALETFDKNIKIKNEALDAAKNAIDEADKNKETTEEVKKGLQESFNKIKAEIDEATAKLDFAKSAKDGKITKEIFTENAAKTIETEASSAIAKSFKLLENVSKKSSSLGKGVFGAIVGFVSGLIVGKMLENKAASEGKKLVA